MFDKVVYLNDNCPPRNQYVLTNCVNIMNEIYKELRQKYRIPQYIDKEKVFEQYLRDNENVGDIYLEDLPTVCKKILESCNGHDDYPMSLIYRIRKLKHFFENK